MKYPQFSENNIKDFRQSCRIAAQTFETIKKLIRLGWTEKETASKVDQIMKNLGADRLAFKTIIAAGNHSANPHHRPTTRKIKKNDIILLDFGCKVNNTCSDLSRTIFIGTPKPEWKKIHHIVQTAQKKAIDFLKRAKGTPPRWPPTNSRGTLRTVEELASNEKIKIKNLDTIARSYIKSKGYGKNFIHYLGHGIGNRPHQYFSIGPKTRAYLKSNMVFTIEPGIYLKGRFGVRIEDVVYLKKGSLEILTIDKFQKF